MHFAPAGDRALLVELGEVSAEELHAAASAVRAMERVVACIPGHSSVYVIFDGEPGDPSSALRAPSPRDRGEKGVASPLAGHNGANGAASPLAPRSGERVAEGRVRGRHVIPVTFDGEDLAELLARVPRDDFFSRIDGLRLTVRYLGFRAGFGYLEGWPREWAMPRRATSRPVKRGSFAIAGDVAGIYPIDTPGGWNILGHTREDVAHRFSPGDEITIVVGEASAAAVTPPPERSRRSAGNEVYDIVAAPLAQFVGSADYSRLDRGLPPGGAFDDDAARLVNRAVGNDEGAPVLECVFAGPHVRFRKACVVAWFAGGLQLFEVNAGEELRLGRITDGLRGYLATGTTRQAVATRRGDRHRIRIVPGPHDIGVRELACVVTAQLDRVGIRLAPERPLSGPAELRSIGMQCGSVQIHPDGSLVAMGPDHPVTGGYAQPFTVMWEERWKLAQLAPGERVTFYSP